MNKALGKEVRERRLRRKFTVRALAAKVGVTHGYISQLENGIGSPPSEEFLRKLAPVIGASLEKLMSLRGKLSKRAAAALADPEKLKNAESAAIGELIRNQPQDPILMKELLKVLPPIDRFQEEWNEKYANTPLKFTRLIYRVFSEHHPSPEARKLFKKQLSEVDKLEGSLGNVSLHIKAPSK
jgi:transcriptional regulator with XRE-family HTH domain